MRQHVPLYWPTPPATQNDRGINPAAKNRLIQQVIGEARLAIRIAHLEPMPLPLVVSLVYRPKDRRRRDPDGLAPTMKHCLDALVAECEWLPDDSWRYIAETRQRIVPPQPDKPAAMWLLLNSEAPPEQDGASLHPKDQPC